MSILDEEGRMVINFTITENGTGIIGTNLTKIGRMVWGLIPAVHVSGEIGNMLRGVVLTNDRVSGEIGDTLRGTVITNDRVSGSIGDQATGVALITSQYVKGSVGDSAAGKVVT